MEEEPEGHGFSDAENFTECLLKSALRLSKPVARVGRARRKGVPQSRSPCRSGRPNAGPRRACAERYRRPLETRIPSPKVAGRYSDFLQTDGMSQRCLPLPPFPDAVAG